MTAFRPTDVPFAKRLALAREMIARGAPLPPVHLADQLDAAGAEARLFHDQLGAVLPLLAPERNWRERLDASPSTDTRAYILAGVLGCVQVCCHLRSAAGPQPAFVQLPLRRVDCMRCVGTVRRPPADEADRCDLCTARGVTRFVPFAMRQGPALVLGDVCPDCAGVLGILQEVAAS